MGKLKDILEKYNLNDKDIEIIIYSIGNIYNHFEF